jgi:hypothetical protein
LAPGEGGLELGYVLVDGGAADSQKFGDRGDGVVGQQSPSRIDLFLSHSRRPAEAGSAGTGSVESFVGALDDHLADELG